MFDLLHILPKATKVLLLQLIEVDRNNMVGTMKLSLIFGFALMILSNVFVIGLNVFVIGLGFVIGLKFPPFSLFLVEHIYHRHILLF